MNKETTPPPPQDVCTQYSPDNLTDYYFGMLLYYDFDSDDNCKWVVYDGQSKVRCPTRKDALNYICKQALSEPDEGARLLLSARMRINDAILELDKAATYQAGASRLLLERLAVRLRPVLVELDNVLTTQHLYDKIMHHQDERETRP